VARKRDEPTCAGYVEGGAREAAKYLVNPSPEDEEPEPPTCEGYVSEESMRRYFTLDELLKEAEEPTRPSTSTSCSSSPRSPSGPRRGSVGVAGDNLPASETLGAASCARRRDTELVQILPHSVGEALHVGAKRFPVRREGGRAPKPFIRPPRHRASSPAGLRPALKLRHRRGRAARHALSRPHRHAPRACSAASCFSNRSRFIRSFDSVAAVISS
jgi:hypothetical protein